MCGAWVVDMCDVLMSRWYVWCFDESLICVMLWSCVAIHVFMCVVDMCDVRCCVAIHSFVNHVMMLCCNPLIRETWIIHTSAMTYSCMCHDSFKRVQWHIHTYDMTHYDMWQDKWHYIWHALCMCLGMCDMTHYDMWHEKWHDMWHALFMCETWLICSCGTCAPPEVYKKKHTLKFSQVNLKKPTNETQFL